MFDFVRLPNVRLDTLGRFHRALALFVVSCLALRSHLFPGENYTVSLYNMGLTFLLKISVRQFFSHAVRKPREKHACYMHVYLNFQRGSAYVFVCVIGVGFVPCGKGTLWYYNLCKAFLSLVKNQ